MEIDKDIKNETMLAYISMEIALESNIPTYSGGLGVLSGDTVRSAADLEIPMVAVCLCYSSGYFYQLFNEKGEQKEKEIQWNFYYEFEKIDEPITIKIEDKDVKVSAWLYKVIGQSGHILPVYLLTTDVEGNESWMKKMTGSLYDSTSRWNRIVQEQILGIGGVKLLENLGYHNIQTYHLNEGHGAFAALELRKKFDNNEEKVKEKVVFTQHTPVPAGHDTFKYELAKKVFQDRLPDNIKTLAGKEELNMTKLALSLCRYSNGVAKKHGQIAQEMFPEYDIDYITNGVHLPFWVSEPMRDLFDRLWPNWKSKPKLLQNALELDDLDLFDAHIENKFKLISYQKGHSWNLLDEELITIGFARRFATYKRAILPFRDIDRLGKICEGRVQFIYAGKAHPKDQEGKNYIKRIFEAGEYLMDNYGVKVVLMENYNMDLAHLLTSGCDVWLNCPARYREASGTSGMKAALNGVLNFSVLDGWWLEAFKRAGGKPEGGECDAGWSIGPDDSFPEAAENDWDKDANYLYDILENKIIPTYQNQPNWLLKQKHSIALAAFFNTHRMVEEYADKAYGLKRQKPWKFERPDIKV